MAIPSNERGAAVVEFALLVPVLLALLIGIMEFGRGYNAQITLTEAAREGARVMAIENDAVLAKTASLRSAPSLDPALMTFDVSSHDSITTAAPVKDKCVPEHRVTFKITYELNTITGLFGPIDLVSQGVMRCGG
ncbi:TadE/TadG family type IV pilus assembly protein [Arthrobacter mangrovi]|nr:TadE family protein [Arthrobacter mangrovi]